MGPSKPVSLSPYTPLIQNEMAYRLEQLARNHQPLTDYYKPVKSTNNEDC